MLQLLRPVLFLTIICGCIGISGCNGQVVEAVKGVQRWQPEAEKHNQEIEELAKPVSSNQGN